MKCTPSSGDTNNSKKKYFFEGLNSFMQMKQKSFALETIQNVQKLLQKKNIKQVCLWRNPNV